MDLRVQADHWGVQVGTPTPYFLAKQREYLTDGCSTEYCSDSL